MTDRDDWYERYDAAVLERDAARTQLSAAHVILAAAELRVKRAEEDMTTIFREKVEITGPIHVLEDKEP